MAQRKLTGVRKQVRRITKRKGYRRINAAAGRPARNISHASNGIRSGTNRFYKRHPKMTRALEAAAPSLFIGTLVANSVGGSFKQRIRNASVGAAGAGAVSVGLYGLKRARQYAKKRRAAKKRVR
jgi:hypothetical protein